MRWTTSEKDDLIAVPHRDAWIASDSTDGGFPFLCNDDDDHPVTIFGLENPNGLSAEGPPHFEVHASLPTHATGPAAAEDVLAAVGEGARAYWGHATPSNATVETLDLDDPAHLDALKRAYERFPKIGGRAAA